MAASRRTDASGEFCGGCPQAVRAGLATCPKCGRDVSETTQAWKDGAQVGAWHTVGSALDADIRMEDTAGKHARIRRVQGNRLEVEDLGRGVMVDGKKTEHAVVPLNARIELGGERLPPELLPDDVLQESELPSYAQSVTMGRTPTACQLVINGLGVSGRHARLTPSEDGWLLEDLESRNGTTVGGQKIRRLQIGWRQPFYVAAVRLTPLEAIKQLQQLKGPVEGTSIVSVEDLAPQAERTTVGAMLMRKVVVGRSPDADIVVDSPHVSLRHASIEPHASGGFLVTDLKSSNGTFVDGVRITAPTLVKPRQVFHLGGYPFKLGLTGPEPRGQKPKVHGIQLELKEACMVAGGATVVDRITVSVGSGEMVAIMGPSGAGKTSLLSLLAGHGVPASGAVLFDGRDAHTHGALFFRHAVALVPQEDVMHRMLTPSEVLFFTGRLNYPDDTSSAEIRARARQVLKRLDLEHAAGSLVGDEVTRGLSGGERKRVNVAMELMQEPSLLLLDEPTSGLDGRSALQLVRQCRGLANAGRTVMMTIHQPREEALQLFDQVLLLTQRGKLAYFGPPAGIRRYFEAHVPDPDAGAANAADFALEALDPQDSTQRRPPRFWAEEFRKSSQFKEMQQRAATAEEDAAPAQAPAVQRTGTLRQWQTLAWRYALVKWRDRAALGLQLLQAPLIAAISALLFHKGRFVPIRGDDDVTPALFVAAASAVWLGTSNVAREVVGERAILNRESRRMVRPGPYLGGVIAVQLALMLLQLPLLVGVEQLAVGFTAPLLLLCAVVMACGCAAMMSGLLLSSLVRTQMAAAVVVPLVILPQILLSGQLAPVGGAQTSVVQRVMAAPMLLRWGYSALVNTEYAPFGPNATETPWTVRAEKGREWVLPRLGFEKDPLWLPFLVVLAMGLAAGLGAWLVLWIRTRRMLKPPAGATPAPPPEPSKANAAAQENETA